MNQSAQSLNETTSNQVLDELVDEITKRLQAGEAVDLDEYVGQYPELEDQLQKLLPGMQMLADLGHSPAEMPSSAESDPSDPDKLARGVLGDFRIVGEIGRGGMGVVYEAEQISLGRRVALKVLPFAALVDPKQLQRFQNEARAAASLDHPNIVHVYSVGCERAVHFYAMQYIEGQTLARVIEELRQLQEPPEDGPDKTAVSELTRLFLASDGSLGNHAEENRASPLAPNGARLRAQGLLFFFSRASHHWIFVSSSFDFPWFLSTGTVTDVVARN